MSAPRVRRAAAADARALSALGRLTFTQTFAHLYPPEDLAAYLDEAHGAGRYGDWLADPAYGLWVVESAGALIGYAMAGPCHLPHPEVTTSCGELWRYYLLREHQGRGLGAPLLAAALDWLDAPGRRLWLGVWSENFGAQRLYARHGFAKVGEYAFQVGQTRDREFILRREPAASASRRNNLD
jgi:GNAT superfamily N-acetyltransferase